MRKYSSRILNRGIFLLLLGYLLSSCHEDTLSNPLRDTEAPVIQLIHPDSGSIIAYVGDLIDFSFEASDDKGLTRFHVDYQVQGPGGSPLVPLTPVAQSELSGTFERLQFSTTVDSFPSFSQVTYIFRVEDQRESQDQVEVVITALQAADSPSAAYPIFTYAPRTLWSAVSDSLPGYNFSTQEAFPAHWENPLSVDITETSTDDTFRAQLSSPNNQRLNRDSIFVPLSPSEINYEEADYTDIRNFYFSASSYLQISPELQAGDLLIIRLTKAPQPQFALMRILDVQDLPGRLGDHLEFEYKVSSE